MNIHEYFSRACRAAPQSPCLCVDDRLLSYTEVDRLAGRVAHAIGEEPQPFTGVFAYRSEVAYAGILGILRKGSAYVPLNPRFPADRNRQIFRLSGLSTIIVGRECLDELAAMVDGEERRLRFVFPDLEKKEVPESLRASHDCVFPGQDDYTDVQAQRSADDFAYMLFTSGSTGVPKGVPIHHGNVQAYVDYLGARYGVRPSDRFSQTFDLTFDLSVHDMFLCWYGGASLYVIPENVLMAPAKFVRKHELTMWFSVPSLAQFMSKFKMLKPGSFPSLRYSLFCGEPMPAALARKFQEAAPASVLENIYGPTEATIGITHYTLDDEQKEHNGILSIGTLFDTQRHLILGEDGNPVPRGGIGELCLGGSQVTRGYWNNPEKTTAQFFTLDEYPGIRWYRTGDLVWEDEDGDIFYVSRVDFQVKIRGYRIELDEINHAICQYLGADVAVSVPYPVVAGIAENIYSFVDSRFEGREAELIAHLGTRLPEYMVPKEIRFIGSFPLNANGKIDRQALTLVLDPEGAK